jgi:hypothetical protein
MEVELLQDLTDVSLERFQATIEGDLDNFSDLADRVRTLEGSLDLTHPGGGLTSVRLTLPVDRADQHISADAPVLGG